MIDESCPCFVFPTYDYDPVGNETHRIDPRLQICTMTYDELNQKVTELYGPGSGSTGGLHTFTYDPVGNQDSFADQVGVTTMTYSPRNETAEVDQPRGRRVPYDYDPAGRRQQMLLEVNGQETGPGAGRFTYTYDNRGLLQSVQNQQGKLTTMTYSPTGRLLTRLQPNGTLTTHTYDGQGRLAGIHTTRSGGGGALVSRFTYTYDRVDNRLTQSSVSAAGSALTTWTYDPVYQLINEQHAASTGDAASFYVTFTYDPAGNRTVRETDGSLTTYTLDAAGNPLEKQAPDGTT